MTIMVRTTSEHFLTPEELENPRIKTAVDRYDCDKVVSLDAIRGCGKTVADELIAAIRQLTGMRYLQIVPIGLAEERTLTPVQESFLRSTCARLV